MHDILIQLMFTRLRLRLQVHTTIINFERAFAIEHLISCTSVFFIVLHEAEELNSCALFGRTYEQLDVGFDTRLDSEIRFSPVGASCIFHTHLAGSIIFRSPTSSNCKEQLPCKSAVC